MGLTLAIYIIPIIVVIFLYGRIGLKLRGSQVIGEATSQQLDIMRSKRKVKKIKCAIIGAKQLFSFITDCQNAYRCGGNICHLLAAVSRVLPRLLAVPANQ